MRVANPPLPPVASTARCLIKNKEKFVLILHDWVMTETATVPTSTQRRTEVHSYGTHFNYGSLRFPEYYFTGFSRWRVTSELTDFIDFSHRTY
jgi:hypothetical protein